MGNPIMVVSEYESVSYGAKMVYEVENVVVLDNEPIDRLAQMCIRDRA